MLRTFLLTLVAAGLMASSCTRQEEVIMVRDGESAYKPILMNRDQLAASVRYQPEPQEMHDPGKIYYKDNFIYVTERYKGVHIINNGDPASPRPAGFITAPGVTDMAIKGSVLYINNATDLVAIDLTNPQGANVLSRVENAFPEMTNTPDGLPLQQQYRTENRPENTVIIEWVKI